MFGIPLSGLTLLQWLPFPDGEAFKYSVLCSICCTELIYVDFLKVPFVSGTLNDYEIVENVFPSTP